MEILGGGIEEKEYGCRVEDEEEDVKHCDFFSNRVDLGFFE